MAGQCWSWKVQCLSPCVPWEQLLLPFLTWPLGNSEPHFQIQFRNWPSGLCIFTFHPALFLSFSLILNYFSLVPSLNLYSIILSYIFLGDYCKFDVGGEWINKMSWILKVQEGPASHQTSSWMTCHRLRLWLCRDQLPVFVCLSLFSSLPTIHFAFLASKWPRPVPSA